MSAQPAQHRSTNRGAALGWFVKGFGVLHCSEPAGANFHSCAYCRHNALYSFGARQVCGLILYGAPDCTRLYL